MKNIKNKMAISASLMALADLLAIGVLLYVGFISMNLLAWTFLLLLVLVFAYDISKAIKFIIAILKH
jgi:hypothetical protein